MIGHLDIGRFITGIREVVAEPQANLTVAVLLLAMFLLVLLIVTLLGLLAISRRNTSTSQTDSASTTSPGRPSAKAARRRLSRAEIWLWAGVTLGLLLGAYASVGFMAHRDTFCAGGCHDVAGIREELKAQGHEGARCLDCHQQSGGLAWLSQPLRWGAHAGRALVRLSASTGAAGPSACLSCHRREILDGVITDSTKGIRISHVEPLAAGARCSDCHGFAGHKLPGSSSMMSTCLRCHDARQASAECSTCHTGDPGMTAVAGATFPQVPPLRVVDCSGCHADQSKCDACHGLRMPHSVQFLAYGHAAQAAFKKKEVCWRCHNSSMCTNCHQAFEKWPNVTGHAENWVTQHAQASSSSMCSCHQAKLPAPQSSKPFCWICHPQLSR